MTESYIFDTYAIIESINGNINYKNYSNKKIIINEFIFAELCYVLNRDSYKYESPEEDLEKLIPFIIHLNPQTIKKAMLFRLNNKKRNLSITDCIGYLMALDLGIKFLTGDIQFKDLPNVEFVK